MRRYYALRYRLDHKDSFLIWHTTDDGREPDGVVVVQGGLVPVFRDRLSLLAYAQAEGLSPIEENASASIDIDIVAEWLRRKRPAKLNCREFLNAWNLLADISASIGGSFDSDKTRTRIVYDKLFWGSNFSSMTPEGKHYTPVWPGRQSRIIREVLGDGLAMLRSCSFYG